MKPADTLQFEGIILRTFPYQERDLIVRILRRDGVKQAFLANAARTKRFGVPLDILDQGTISARQGRGTLMNLSAFQPRHSFPQIRTSIDRFCAAITFTECLDFLIPEDGPESPELFTLLEMVLCELCESVELSAQLRALYFGIHKLIELCGYGAGEPALPSTNSIMHLLQRVEHVAERALQSKSSLLLCMEGLRSKSQADTDGQTK
ncbi:MAG: DNA repair protein RecO [Bdellovibrionota bacterium]|nr:MAG: DNA repair protein RecO [Bdellovibrionota bacterium]